MPSQHCLGPICFYALDSNGPKIFGFAEYLAGLALIVLAWTIADTRYQFRVAAAPIPLQRTAFFSVALIGVLTLLTDLWRAQKWLVPIGPPLSPAIWQAFLGFAFLLTVIGWAWFAFIRPSTFSPRNAERFTQFVYRAILRGSPSELAVIADEIARSAQMLISYAPDEHRRRQAQRTCTSSDIKNCVSQKDVVEGLTDVEVYAHEFLRLIADRRFCKAVVSDSSLVALAIFREIAKRRKYSIAISAFTRNIVSEALLNKDSFLYHETEGYETGLVGQVRPLSQAIFGDYGMLAGVDAALDVEATDYTEWDAETWKAYCRATLVALGAYVHAGLPELSPIWFRLKSRLESATHDIYKLNDTVSIDWRSEPLAKVRVIVQFVKCALEALDERPVSKYVALRVRQKYGSEYHIYDLIAELIVDILHCAAAVRAPVDTCWMIQYSTVWSALFDSFTPAGHASKFVKHKVRRMLYDQVVKMERFPNFMGARLLSICLNTMGLRRECGVRDRDCRALHRALLAWTSRNLVALNEANAEVAMACLVEGITYEAENSRIVKSYRAGGLRVKPSFVYLDVVRSPASGAM